ncbi:DUF2141 domain-containing protein [Undibacterium sp.]|jgi:uncharacterized protein (DUF2141 family)|uniref:DUF2141 domain-containing protein n=1 Tax=Undibacterium sp. TaxID=1914977 RepID=UPI002B85126D|nr:DUF2141 domain-containing protein [Undibacterium sp.]HTD05180.1 DUF2141 domain-containing protein [Undibacterium sp.]
MKLKPLQKLAVAGATVLLAGAAAIPSQAADLTVNVKNLRSQNGMLMLALFNSADSFLKPEKQYGAQMISASQQPGVMVFKNLPAGRYAVSVFQDENRNGKMDSNMLGVPTERYGFSNNAMGTMGPPSFEQAAISLTDSREITIDLR